MENSIKKKSDIDENLQSRQLAVYGKDTMKKIMGSKVLISGLNGLGLEIAKNLILANVQQVTIHDIKTITTMDLGAHFYATNDELNKNRASVSLKKLQELNPNTTVSLITCELSNDILESQDTIVCVDTPLNEAIRINNFCRTRENPIYFIRADVRGLCGTIFTDFGKNFIVNDIDGEQESTAIIESIEKGYHTKINCIFEEDGRHNLQDGDIVKFSVVV